MSIPVDYVIRIMCRDKEALWIGPYEATPETALDQGRAFADLYFPRPFTVVEFCRGSGSVHLIPPPVIVGQEFI